MFRQLYKIAPNNEVIFKVCPNCGNRRWNFQVNRKSGKFHCWVCGFGGHNGWKYLYGVPEAAQVVIEKEIEEDVNTLMTYNIFDGSTEGNMALDYLKNRGLTEEIIDRYVDGYVPFGKYKGRIVLMLFDTDMSPAYWLARTYKCQNPKYLNPPRPKQRALGFFDGDEKRGEVLCVEGWFDAIAWKKVHTNVCVMLGKALNKFQIFDLCEVFTKLTVVLDNDAKREDFDRWNRWKQRGYPVTVKCMPDTRDADEVPESILRDTLTKSDLVGELDILLKDLDFYKKS